MIQVIEIEQKLSAAYNQLLLEFEKKFKYPLGQDSFTISHGSNYFTFFERLGEPHFFIAKNEQSIVAVMTMVLRNINIHFKQKPTLIWYICDLKIDPNYQGRFIIQRFLEFVIPRYSHLSELAYGISMNEDKINFNRLVRFAQRIPQLGLKMQETLVFYLLDDKQIQSIEHIFQKYFKNYSFISLSSIKNLIISSTQAPLPLVHFSKRHYSDQHSDQLKLNPKEHGNNYMICLPITHPIIAEISKFNLNHLTTASIISNISNMDWSFIESSEI